MPESNLEISNRIFSFRGCRVILDSDLAELYGVESKVLNQAVKRNLDRFPGDFMFQLTVKEFEALRSQSVTLKRGRGRHRKYLPYAFTEQGVAMLSSVLNSKRAILVNITIMRAFVRIRETQESRRDFSRHLLRLERNFRLHDRKFATVFAAIHRLLAAGTSQTRKRIRGLGR